MPYVTQKAGPFGFVLTPGQTHDTPGLCPSVLDDRRPDRGAARDKGYDADAIREEIAKADIEAVIPVQQAQELAMRCHPIRQDQGNLPRLCRHRRCQTMDTLCPPALARTLLYHLADVWIARAGLDLMERDPPNSLCFRRAAARS
ncbi:transposase [Mesorhizobium amorphae]|uniref:transposase n=1 Tax=Mesorhizobium amorphae TaxID=71433 RepID=UPI003D1060FF